MSVDITVTLRGTALLQPQKAIASAIKTTYKNTATYALSTVRSITPIRTGRMRDGWEIQNDLSETMRISNPVPYAVYVDDRRLIVQRSLPAIEQYFKDDLLKNGLAELDSP